MNQFIHHIPVAYKRLLAPLVGLFMFCLTSAGVWATGSTSVVISQVYGGGGNTGATYKNDFIELHNISAAEVSIAGWSVQYASATGVSWQVTNLTGSIPAGGYYMIQEAAGTGGTVSLPTPQATGTLAMSGTAGKVALVNNSTALTGASPTGANIIDLVGFGTTATYFEGTGQSPAPSNTTAVLRKDNGSTDTNNNATDFTAGAPAPRNSATTPYRPGPVASQIRVETLANGSGTPVAAQNLAPGASLTVYAVSRDLTNTFVANCAADTWTPTNLTGNVVTGDLVASSDGKSAVFTGHLSGTAVIHATSGTLASIDSGTLTVTSAQTDPSAVATATPATVAPGSATTLAVVVTPGTNPASTGITVSADLSSIGGASTATFTGDGNGGSFTALATVLSNITTGGKSLPVMVSDAQGRNCSATIALKVAGAVTIFHMNDTHARLTPHKWIIPAHGSTDGPFEDVGGAAFLAGKMLALTDANPSALVIDAGDISEGNPIGDMNGNGSMTGFYTMLSAKLKTQRDRGMDATVVGNHDVRDASYIANLEDLNKTVPVISMNVRDISTHKPHFNAYTIVMVNGHYR